MDDCYVPSTYKDAMRDSWKLSDRGGAGEPRISEDSGPFVTSWQVAAALWVLLGKPGGARARDVLRGFLAPGFWDLPASERWWTPPPFPPVILGALGMQIGRKARWWVPHRGARVRARAHHDRRGVGWL